VNADIIDFYEQPILFEFIQNRNKEMIELLALKGGNIHILNDRNWNALHFSASNGDLQITKYLVSLGIDYKAKNKHGKTPIDVAKAMKYLEDSKSDEISAVIDFLALVEKK